MNDPLTYVIVLNWNGRQHLETCLGSLSRLAYSNYKIVLVDNGSTDGSVQFIEENFPHVEIIRNKKNVGFCKGNNQGMRLAIERGAKYLALLNNDTEVEGDWLGELVQAAEADQSIGALSSKMLLFNDRDIINSTGVVCTPYGNAVDRGLGRHDAPKWNKPGEVLAVCGGAYFARCSVLREVGLFPNYTIYLEDVDLSCRIWNAGYRIVYVPSAVVYHKFSATMGEGKNFKRKIYLNTRNRLWIIAKHYPITKIKFILHQLFWLEKRIIIGSAKQSMGWKSITELKAILYTVLLLPYFAAYRIHRFFKGTWRCRFWRLVDLNGTYFPVYNLPEKRHPPTPEQMRHLVLMGENETSLGRGWYKVEEDAGTKYRWMGKTSDVFLSAPPGKAVLLLKMSCPYEHIKSTKLTIKLNGIEVSSFPVKKEWSLYRIPLPEQGAKLRVELVAENVYDADVTGGPADYSFRVAELLLSPQTPVPASPATRTS